MKKFRVKNPDKVISNLTDPTGWTFNNNPHPNIWSNPNDESDYRNWMEWDEDSTHPIRCHLCIARAKIGSGNCIDGGDYFICLPKDVREGKRKLPKPTKQVKLM